MIKTKGLEYVLGREYRCSCAECNGAFVQEKRLVEQFVSIVEVVMRGNNEAPLAGKSSQLLPQRFHARYIKAGKGFIQQQDVSFLCSAV